MGEDAAHTVMDVLRGYGHNAFLKKTGREPSSVISGGSFIAWATWEWVAPSRGFVSGSSMVPSTREEAIAFLMKSINYEQQVPKSASDSTYKLQTMRWLANYFGDPHLRFPVIHIAGTKGKGSTANMIAQILAESGARVGLYTSPHLHRLEERIVVNGVPIDEDGLVSAVQQLSQAVEVLQSQLRDGDYSGNPPTFFELLTMAAWLHFARQSVDVAVVEVGLGGRLDSTNICQPQLGVITSISHDHMQQLGHRLSQIATEKAGIIKPGMSIVSGVDTPEAAAVIRQRAQEVGAKLFVLGEDFQLGSAREDSTPNETGASSADAAGEFRWLTSSLATAEKSQPISGLKVGLRGRHQVRNAGLATAACLLFEELGRAVTSSSIRQGLLNARPAGRIEVISGSVPLVVDVAHNPAAIQALVDTLSEQRQSYRKIRVVLGISEDKDAEKILQPLLSFVDVLILTAFQDNPRAVEPEKLLEIAQAQAMQQSIEQSVEIRMLQDPQAVFAWLESTADSRDLTVVTGSTFLVSEMRTGLQTWNHPGSESESITTHALR